MPETENGLIQETPIENLFFEYQLSTNPEKNENPFGKGHTVDSSRWCATRCNSVTYMFNNFQISEVLMFPNTL